MAHTKRFVHQIIFVVVTMIFILGFSIDLYSPSFPDIAKSLRTSNQLVQLTISTYFFGYMMGIILIGPVLDTFGRKKPILICLSFYCLMSILCSYSRTIDMLLALRMLQGIGVAVVGVGFRAILSDVFIGQRLATAMTYTSMSYRLGPIIAPFIGGYLAVYFGWQSNFYLLALYSAFLILIVSIFLPETHLERSFFHPKKILQKYVSVLKNLPFLGGALCSGILYGMMIIFNVVGPFFIQDILKYSPITFGHIAFIIGFFSFLGIILNRFLLKKHSREKLVRLGMYSILIICFSQVIVSFIFPINLYAFIIPILLVIFTTGLIISNMMSRSLDLISLEKGTASALQGFLMIVTTGILTFLASFLKSNTIVPFAWTYFSLFILCFIFYQTLYKKKST